MNSRSRRSETPSLSSTIKAAVLALAIVVTFLALSTLVSQEHAAQAAVSGAAST